MARELLEVVKESVAVETQLLAYKGIENLDIEAVRKSVRKNVILGNEIDQNNQLEVLLKKEYELQRETDELNLPYELAKAGQDPKTIIFNQIIEQKLLEKDLALFTAEAEERRNNVRRDVVLGNEIDQNDKLAVMLKREYELQREIDEWNLANEWAAAGKNPSTTLFKYTAELQQLKKDLSVFTDEESVQKRKRVRELVSERRLVDTHDTLTSLFLRERGLERRLLQAEIEEKYVGQGYDRKSDIFKKSVELDMLREDMKELNPDLLEQKKLEYEELKKSGQEKENNDSYIITLRKEDQLQTDIDGIKRAEEQKEKEEKQRQEDLARQKEEAEKKQQEEIIKNLYTTEEPEKPKKGILGGFFNLFRRKPKTEPAKTEAVVEEPVATETVKEENKEEKTNEVSNEKETTKETSNEKTDSKDKEVKEPTKEELEEKQKKEKADKAKEAQERKRKKEEERQRKYRVEFAGKDLDPKIKNCGNIEQLVEQLEKNQNLSEEQKEHLQKRIGAIAKVQALETSRTIKQKNRPPCIKYKDGTILLKNKRHDVAKQSSMNGCWSAVLSDMLGHFGVDLTQEEIRAYRPDLAAEMANKDVKAFMERLNKDETNEINAMADLIQRVVPNVAQHHMSISTKNPANMAVVKETVTDALLNKNSPVAVCYKGHYLSIVGIKGDTLVVQNPDPRFDTKYQRLAIDDLFAAGGQVTLDWMEDLKFTKEGACKNATSQWDSMGIKCDKREFVAGKNPNQPLHLKGNEYYDTYRVSQGIEETIYMPKMSFGKEKELAQKEINQQQLKNINQGILEIENVQLNPLNNDDTEIHNENEMQQNEL